jgi:hypothetical protein
MLRRWNLILAQAGLVCLLAGCGGGSGGGSNTDQGAIVQIQLVGLISGTSSPVSFSTTPLPVGTKVQFELEGVYSETGNSALIKPTGWTTTAPSSIATITSSGLLSATGGSKNQTYQVSVTYGGQTYGTTYSVVNTNSAEVVGTVLTSNGGAVPGATIKFSTAAGALAGTATSGQNGSFVGLVPASATKFSVTVGSSYYSVFSYGTSTFASSISGCVASLPALKDGVVTVLPNSVVVYVNDTTDPPPPPDGCQ